MKLATSRAAARTQKHTPCQEEGRCSVSTRLGLLHLRWRGQALTRLRLGGRSTASGPETAPDWVQRLVERIHRHLAGESDDFRDVAVDLSGLGPFQRQVLTALRAVRPGRTTTYAELAARVGSRGAARAVGGAMRRNPILLVVPCHRVLRSDGGLGGFSARGGVAVKRELLACEGAVA